VGRPPLAAHTLALLDDGIHCRVRRLQVRDRRELRPAEICGGSLRGWWTDEQAPFADFGGEPGKANVNRPVQVAHCLEILVVSDDGVFIPERARNRLRLLRGGEPSGIFERHAFRSLQIQEMAQGLLAKWDKRQAYARRKVRCR
jgi:hypothetical protein